jgi:hypothetical protein
MSDNAHFLVKVDLKRLRANLSAHWGTPLADENAREFLLHCGFRREGHAWIAREDRLMLLDPSEIVWTREVGPVAHAKAVRA